MEDKVWFKSYDPGVPKEIDFEDLPLHQILARTARNHPNSVALIFMNSKITYKQLQDKVDRLATALAALGVKNSRVAIQLPNLPQTVIGYYAVQRLGAQVVMTNPLYMPREIEHQWRDAGVEVAICADFLYQSRIAELKPKLPAKHYIIAQIPEYLRFPLNLLAPLKLKKAKPIPMIAKIAPGPDIHYFKS